jgi:RNA dependent RNA polymerase
MIDTPTNHQDDPVTDAVTPSVNDSNTLTSNLHLPPNHPIPTGGSRPVHYQNTATRTTTGTTNRPTTNQQQDGTIPIPYHHQPSTTVRTTRQSRPQPQREQQQQRMQPPVPVASHDVRISADTNRNVNDWEDVHTTISMSSSLTPTSMVHSTMLSSNDPLDAIHRFNEFRMDVTHLVDKHGIAFHERTLAHLLFPKRLRIFKFDIQKCSFRQFSTCFTDHLNGCTYELLSAKLLRRVESHLPPTKQIQAMYVLTRGGLGSSIPPIDLQQELERIANFGQLTTEKVAARLELLQSPAYVRSSSKTKQPLVLSNVITVDDIEEIAEIAHEGCGFMPVHFAQQFYGHHAVGKRIFALQVRIVAPQLGIYKGMLVVKEGIDRIQLPTSMKKVGPSTIIDPNDKRVFLLINGSFPSKINAIQFPKIFQNLQPCKSFQPKKLSYMIQRIWQDWRIPDTVIKQYIEDSCNPNKLRHTCLVGLSDPTDGGIPPGTVFITGMAQYRDGNIDTYNHPAPIGDSIFITRYPCTEARTDAHLLPVLRHRPSNMLESTWQWLNSLHFGGIIFGNPVSHGNNTTAATPLPCQIANGDLDGDMYFVCWDEVLLEHLHAQRTVGISQSLANSPPSKSSTTASTSSARMYNVNWFRDGQMRMSDTQLSNISDLISKIYSLWKKNDLPRNDDGSITSRRPSSSSPVSDIDYVGRAYKDALDLVKHGGKVYLPSYLWPKIPVSLHLFLRQFRHEQ